MGEHHNTQSITYHFITLSNKENLSGSDLPFSRIYHRDVMDITHVLQVHVPLRSGTILQLKLCVSCAEIEPVMVHTIAVSPEWDRAPLNSLLAPKLPVGQIETISCGAMPSEAFALCSAPLSLLPSLGSGLHLHQKVPPTRTYSLPSILILPQPPQSPIVFRAAQGEPEISQCVDSFPDSSPSLCLIYDQTAQRKDEE
jgi:hypothetical protein